MIGISKLYCGTVEPSDILRYGAKSSNLPSNLLQFSSDKKPVVVWNCTRRCNLNCCHCYSQSQNIHYDGELDTNEAIRFIDDLADFGIPVLLFSGGEPLMRQDLFELVTYARNKGIRAVISTNGTMINDQIAQKMKSAGLSYVGVSLDGISDINDSFRGSAGAFDRALRGIRSCRETGVKVGLRFTITKDNAGEIPGIFDLLEQEKIPRICFYHLVYTGRGTELTDNDLEHTETRKLLDYIIDSTERLHQKGNKVEVLTVDNHADGVYLYLRMIRQKNPRASKVLDLLTMNGGNSSGIGIGCVSWDGTVHPDQFWRHYSFGNIRQKPFSQIWTNPDDQMLNNLHHRKDLLKGKCSRCVWKTICNGNLRVRAEAVYGDIWESDPACYLTEDEIKGYI